MKTATREKLSHALGLVKEAEGELEPLVKASARMAPNHGPRLTIELLRIQQAREYLEKLWWKNGTDADDDTVTL